MKPIHFIHQDDLYGTDMLLRKLLDSLEKKSSKESVIVTTYYGDTVNPSTLSDHVSTPLMMGMHSMLIIKEYNKIRDAKIIINSLNQAIQSFVICLIKTGLDFHSSALETFVRQRTQDIHVHRLVKPNHSLLKKRILDIFKHHPMRFSPEALDLLIERHEDTPDTLYQELQKIILYTSTADTATVITPSLIEPLLLHEKETKIYTFIDAFLSKKRYQAYRSFLEAIQTAKDLIGLQAFLRTEVYRLIRYKELKQKAMSDNDLFQTMKIYYYKVKQNLQKRAALLPLSRLYALLNDLITLEKILKSESFSGVAINKQSLNYKAKYFMEKLIDEYC